MERSNNALFKRLILLLFFFVVFLGFANVANAAYSYQNITNCANTTTDAFLNVSDRYYTLMRDLNTSIINNCLNVTAINVVLDCKGFKINFVNGTAVTMNTSNFTMKNCYFNHTDVLSTATPLSGASGTFSFQNNTIVNNTFMTFGANSPISFSSSVNNTFANNTFITQAFNAIYLASSVDNNIMGNVFNYTGSQADIYDYGSIEIGTPSNRTLIASNIIYNSNRIAGINVICSDFSPCENFWFYNNSIYNTNVSYNFRYVRLSTIDGGNLSSPHNSIVAYNSSLTVKNLYSTPRFSFRTTNVTFTNLYLMNSSIDGDVFFTNYSIHYDSVVITQTNARNTSGNIGVGPNFVEVNSNNLPEFNTTANLTLMIGAGLTNATVVPMKNNVYCGSSCTFKAYNSNTGFVTMNVPSFTNFSTVTDTTIPTVSYSCSPATVYTGDLITCSCSGADTVDPSPTITYSQNPSTANVGAFTSSCTVTDLAGNSVTSSVFNYNVIASGGGAAGGGSSGGGGGGITSGPSQTFGTMNAGQVYKYFLTDVNGAIQVVAITPTETVSGVKISSGESTTKPSDLATSPNGEIFKYAQITTTNLLNSQVQTATVTFVVDKTWVDAKGSKENVVLMRFNNNLWEKLTTKFVKENNGKYEYQAETPGFSYFAVAYLTPEAVTKPVVAKPTTTTANSAEVPSVPASENLFDQKQATKRNWKPIVYSLIVILVIGLAIFFVYKKNQEASLNRYRYKNNRR